MALNIVSSGERHSRSFADSEASFLLFQTCMAHFRVRLLFSDRKISSLLLSVSSRRDDSSTAARIKAPIYTRAIP